MSIHRSRSLLLPLLTGLLACHEAPTPGPELAAGSSGTSDDGSSDTALADSGSTTDEPAPPDACAETCLDVSTREGTSLCHACRCKVAFDDWMPPVEELQCGNAVPIVTYHAQLSDTDFELQPTGPSAMDCANPSLLTGSCRQGSRLGHLVHDDVSVYWICRDPYLDLDGTVLFEDMAVIASNLRTGATCYWDDINDVTHEYDAPPLDLLEASEEDRARSIENFPHNDGSGCVNCHDHDPFIYTPYLQSTGWQTVAADKGPYHRVGLGPTPEPTAVQHLVSPEAAACTTCHRIGSNATCSFFAPDSFAAYKTDDYEDEVHAAAEPGSPHWKLAYWMPSPLPDITDFAEWEAAFGPARDHIQQCCEAPGVDVDGCQWEPVPALPPR